MDNKKLMQELLDKAEANMKPSDDRQGIIRIMQGLLASGHYTEPETEYSNPKILKTDRGKEFKEDGYKTRRVPLVVIDAVWILGALDRYIWEQAEIKREEEEELQEEQDEKSGK